MKEIKYFSLNRIKKVLIRKIYMTINVGHGVELETTSFSLQY